MAPLGSSTSTPKPALSAGENGDDARVRKIVMTCRAEISARQRKVFAASYQQEEQRAGFECVVLRQAERSLPDLQQQKQQIEEAEHGVARRQILFVEPHPGSGKLELRSKRGRAQRSKRPRAR